MISSSIRRVSKHEIPVLALFLAEIFFDSEVYIHIFSDEHTRRERLKWLFEKNLILQHAEKNTWLIVAETVKVVTTVSDIVATLTFLPSAEKKNSVADYIREGLLTMPFKFGFSAFKSLLKANNFNEKELRQIAGDKPFWYLTMVAVAEKHRGKGIAGQLIMHVILNNTNTKTFYDGYTSVLLTTQLESNVKLYNKLGFLTMDINDFGNYFTWTMKKNLPLLTKI